MGRHSLRIVMVLGVLVTLVGGTGIFAVFSDRSTTGTNSVTSGERPHAVDIKISEAQLVGGVVHCDGDGDGIPFEGEDLTTGLFTITNIQPDTTITDAYVCIQNAGSAAVDVAVLPIDVVDTDVACTGDEEVAGDTTCGADQAGELSDLVSLQIWEIDCNTAEGAVVQTDGIGNLILNPIVLPTSIQPGGIACVKVDVYYHESTPELDRQLAQSDKAEWRIAFDATLAP